MCFLLCFHLVQGSRFKVQGCSGGFVAFFYWAMPESGIQVTSHSYDTRERIVPHVWKGFHLGDMLRVLELTVLYYDTSSPLEKGRAKGAGWIHEAV